MSQQNWNIPWTTEEIIKNADNWTLAGDAALLNTIKDFAEKMITKSEDVSNNIDKLLHSADELQLKLNITQNEFNSLKNSQFIENRVQEEDETLEVVEERQSPVVLSDENQSQIINDSIKLGIEMMEKYYDNVEISISDSEGESERSFILKPKDLYADRPLPPIIGSEDWYGKWHSDDSSSDSECDKVSETYSDTDTEEDIPKDLNKMSESSSELDFSSVTSEGRPVGSSTFNDSSKKTADFVPSSEESDGNLETQSAKTPLASKTFAEQLSAKLGLVSKNEEPPQEDVNKRPIKTVKNNNYIDPVFSDEPPPLDDGQDKSSVKNIYSDLFSGGQGLFDDSEDDFWEPKKPTMKQLPVEEKTAIINPQVDNLFDKTEENEDDDLFSTIPKKSTNPLTQSIFDNKIESQTTEQKEIKKEVKSIFEDVEQEDDDDLFAPKEPTIAPPPLASDSSGDNSVTSSSKKKPIGGVSVFGSADHFANKNIKDILGNKGSPKSHSTYNKPNITNEKPNVFPKSSDIANDSKSSTDKIIKKEQNVPPKPNTSIISSENRKNKNIFDDNDDDMNFIPPKPQKDVIAVKKTNIFDEDDDDLFGDAAKQNVLLKIEVSSKEEARSNKPNNDIFEDLFASTSSSSNQMKTTSAVKSYNLFDDDDLAKYDLFADIPKEDDFEDLFSSTSKIINESKLFINETTTNTSKKADIKKTEDIFSHNSENIEQENTVNKSNEKILEKATATEKNEIIFDEPVVEDNTRVENNSNIFDSETASKNISSGEVHTNTNEPEVPETDSITTEPFSPVVETRTEKQSTPPTDNTESATESSATSQPENDVKNDDIDDGYPTDIKNIPEDDLFSSKPPSSSQPQGLFDDFQTGSIFDDIIPAHQLSQVLKKDEKEEPKRVISLFDTTPPPDDEDDDWDTRSDNLSDNDDLFSYTEVEDAPRCTIFDSEPPSLEPQSVVQKDQNLKRDQHLNGPPPTMKLPPKSVIPIPSKNPTVDEVEKISGGPSDLLPIATTVSDSALKKIPDDKEISSGSLSKLKMNLNINVNALRPNFAPPKFKEKPSQQPETISTVMRSPSPPDTDNAAQASEVVDGNRPLSTRAGAVDRAPAKNIEKGVSFEDDLASHEVLHSYTKDRAKIPLKRKPSTKRGRQETIRRTATADPIDIESKEAKMTEIHKAVSEGMLPASDTKEQIANIVEFSNPLIDSLDSASKINEDNASNIDSNVPVVNKEEKSEDDPFTHKAQSPLFSTRKNKEIKHEKPSFSPLFEKDINVKDVKPPTLNSIFKEIDKEDIFSNKSHQLKKKEEVTNKTKNSLFESSDSDDDLFGKSEMKKSKAKVTKSAAKKGLFDDSSSEDDLFGSKKN